MHTSAGNSYMVSLHLPPFLSPIHFVFVCVGVGETVTAAGSTCTFGVYCIQALAGSICVHMAMLPQFVCAPGYRHSALQNVVSPNQ